MGAFALALAPASVELTEQRLCLRLPCALIGSSERLARLLQDVFAGRIGRPPGFAESKEQARPLEIIGRPKRQRELVETRRCGECVQRQRSVPGVAEGEPRRLGELAWVLARRLGELDRTDIVVSEHLGSVLRAFRAER